LRGAGGRWKEEERQAITALQEEEKERQAFTTLLGEEEKRKKW